MTEQNMAALVDFVRHNPSGLTAVKKWEHTLHVVTELVMRDFPADEVVTRIFHSPFAVELLKGLSKAYLPSVNAKAFGLAVYQNRHSQRERRRADTDFARNIDNEMLQIFRHPTVCEELCRTLSKDEIIAVFGSEFYWERQIRRFIAKGDLDRAYDEILGLSSEMWNHDLRQYLQELAIAVGEEKLKQAPPRKMADSSRVYKIRRNFTSGYGYPVYNEKHPAYTLDLLHNYFGGRKAERKRTRNERKLREYEAGLK
jgi:hypothetical protein